MAGLQREAQLVAVRHSALALLHVAYPYRRLRVKDCAGFAGCGHGTIGLAVAVFDWTALVNEAPGHVWGLLSGPGRTVPMWSRCFGVFAAGAAMCVTVTMASAAAAEPEPRLVAGPVAVSGP